MYFYFLLTLNIADEAKSGVEPLSSNYLAMFLCCVDDERNDLSLGNYNDIKCEMAVSHLTTRNRFVVKQFWLK